MNIIKNEKDRKRLTKEIAESLKPLEEALKVFKEAVEKVNWEELNKECVYLKTSGQRENQQKNI